MAERSALTDEQPESERDLWAGPLPPNVPMRQVLLPHSHLPLHVRGLDVDALDALVHADADPERLPYWAVLWPTAVALAGHLCAMQCWRGQEVLELGCGPGLSGIALATAGAHVMQSDLFPDAVALARENVRANGIDCGRFVAADWHAWPFRTRWPVIVGSDLTYERPSHAALLRVLETALAPGGTAYLADPDRPMSLDFFARAEGAGWQVDISHLGEHEGQSVHVYRLRNGGVIGRRDRGGGGG